MSKSYHVTYKDLKTKTKKEIDAMVDDPESILHKLVEKNRTKKAVQKQRKNSKVEKVT